MNDARVIIHFLNEQAGRSYQERASNFKLICGRLEEVDGDVDGVKRMIVRQCRLWKGDPKMCECLTVDTLFRKSNFGKYYDNRDFPVMSAGPTGPPKPPSQMGKDIAARRQRDFLNTDINLPD